MSDDERRVGARFLTELTVCLRATKGGEILDDRATAHEISTKGFKIETQFALAEKALVSFVIELPDGRGVAGKGRVVWANREQLATWAGIQITAMSWGDKRRLSALINPDQVNWSRIVDLCVKLVIIVTVIIASHRLLISPLARGVLSRMAPKIIALMIMGWALIGMLKREKRR